jgi:hypothetical protein
MELKDDLECEYDRRDTSFNCMITIQGYFKMWKQKQATSACLHVLKNEYAVLMLQFKSWIISY